MGRKEEGLGCQLVRILCYAMGVMIMKLFLKWSRVRMNTHYLESHHTAHQYLNVLGHLPFAVILQVFTYLCCTVICKNFDVTQTTCRWHACVVDTAHNPLLVSFLYSNEKWGHHCLVVEIYQPIDIFTLSRASNVMTSLTGCESRRAQCAV